MDSTGMRFKFVCIQCAEPQEPDCLYQFEKCGHTVCTECLQVYQVSQNLNCPVEECVTTRFTIDTTTTQLSQEEDKATLTEENGETLGGASKGNEYDKCDGEDCLEVARKEFYEFVAKADRGEIVHLVEELEKLEKKRFRSCDACEKEFLLESMTITCFNVLNDECTGHICCFNCLFRSLRKNGSKCPVHNCGESMVQNAKWWLREKQKTVLTGHNTAHFKSSNESKTEKEKDGKFLQLKVKEYGSVHSKVVPIWSECNLRETARMIFENLNSDSGPLSCMGLYIYRHIDKLGTIYADGRTAKTSGTREKVEEDSLSEYELAKEELDEGGGEVERPSGSDAKAVFEKIYWETDERKIGQVIKHSLDLVTLDWYGQLEQISP